MKWQTLEHHGMTFPPAYKPLPTGVKLFAKAGKQKIDLSLPMEELATWWAIEEQTEFGAKDKVKENFWLTFKLAMDKVSICRMISNFIFVFHNRNWISKVSTIWTLVKSEHI